MTTHFLPDESSTLAAVGALLAAILSVGYVLNRTDGGNRSRLIAWLQVGAAVGLAERLTANQPAGFRMLCLIAALLYAMKGVVAVESRRGGKPPLGIVGWSAFCVLWFGMRPAVFAGFPGRRRRDSREIVLLGACSLLAGIGLILAARIVAERFSVSTLARPESYAALGMLMIGLSLAVHFGLFDLLAGLLRVFGADCPKLFRFPLRSLSLTEFWSRRWNVAFSEMTALAVYRPCRGILGPAGAKFAAFLFSGLLHELAISVPVKSGFGLPMVYFVLHALAMQLETTAVLRRLLMYRPFARAWTAAWLLLPLPLLFHRAFCEEILLPLL